MADADDVTDTKTRRLFVGVFVCEAATIFGLWWFSRVFS
jgi:hypothetical protein